MVGVTTGKPRVFDLSQEDMEPPEATRVLIDPSLLTRELRLSTRFTGPIVDQSIRKLLLRVSPRWLPKKDERFDFLIRKSGGQSDDFTYWRSGLCLADPVPVLITYAKQRPLLFYGVDHGAQSCQFKLEAMTEQADAFAKERGFQGFGFLAKFFRTIKDKETGNIKELTEIVVYDFQFDLSPETSNDNDGEE